MGTLLSNGSSLYRHNGALLRTPITITLESDEACGYSVCGSYTSTGFPYHGLTHGTSPGNMRTARERLESMLRTPTNPLQIWRQVTTAGYQVEFAWHQGSCYLSAQYPDLVYTQGETYMQLCGYHFTLPRSLNGLEVTGLRIKYHNGGTIVCGGEAQEVSASNRKALSYFAGKYGRNGITYKYPATVYWKEKRYENPLYYLTTPINTSFPVRFVSLATRPPDDDTYETLEELPYDEVDLTDLTDDAIAAGAGIGGWRRIWTNGTPGAIPILTNAGSRIETLISENNLSVINQNRSAWFFVFAPLSAVNRAVTIDDLEAGGEDDTPPYTYLSRTTVPRGDPPNFNEYSHMYNNWSRINSKAEMHTWATQTPNVAAASLWGLQLEVDLG